MTKPTTFPGLFNLLVAVLLCSCAIEPVPSEPTLSIGPERGGPSTAVTVDGDRYPPRTNVKVRLGPPDVGQSPEAYGQARTDDTGSFRITFNMPAAWPDGRPILEQQLLIIAINDDGSTKATATFIYEPTLTEPTLSLNPNNGAPGQRVVATGAGFPASANIGLRLGVPDNGLNEEYLALITSNDDGAFSTILTIPPMWPQSSTPVAEQSLLIAAVDVANNRTLATAPFLNTKGYPTGAYYEPLDEEACEALRTTIAQTLSVEVVRSEASVPFRDMLTGLPGESCQLSAGGTGKNFAHLRDVVAALNALLGREGWVVDNRYVMGQTTGATFGVRRDEAMGIVSVEWHPSAISRCRNHESISACIERLPPQQIIYRIVLDFVQLQ